MLEQLLDEATLAARSGDEQRAEQLIRQLASSPDPEVVDRVIQALEKGPKLRQWIVIRVLQLLGYPKNEPAIPELIYHLGDPNLPGWKEAVDILNAMEADVVLPYLIRALLDQEAFWQYGEKRYPRWGSNVEGVCYWLTHATVKKEYSRCCCPTVITLLSQAELLQGPGAPDVDLLLDVVEKADDQEEYIIPTLIALAKKYRDDHLIGTHARMLLAAFKQEALAPYKLWAGSL